MATAGNDGGRRGAALSARAVLAAYRRAFSGLPRPVWLLAVATLVHRSGTMVLPFLTLYLTGPVGMSAERAGLAFGLYGAGSLLGTWLGGWLSDRLGSLPVQTGSLLAAGVGFYVLGRVRGEVAIFVTLFVVALVADVFRPANGVAFAERTAPAQRSRAFALRRLAINLGMTVGPAVGGFLAQVDYLWLFVADGATCVAAALLLVGFFGRAATLTPRLSEARRPAAAVAPLRDRSFLLFLLGIGLFSAVFVQFLAALPLALRDGYGMQEHQIGLVFAVNTVLIVLFEMVLTDRLSAVAPLRAVAWGGLAVGLGFGLVPFGDRASFAVLVIAVVTLGEMLALPQAESWATSRAGSGAQGRYLALFGVAFAAALTAGPAAGTWIYGRLGPRILWTACAAAGAVVWLAFSALSRRDSAAPRAPETRPDRRDAAAER